jgi:hypothetical protein
MANSGTCNSADLVAIAGGMAVPIIAKTSSPRNLIASHIFPSLVSVGDTN